MFRPINEFNDSNINIETCLSNLLNLKSELFNIEKQIEKLNIQTQVQQNLLIENFKLPILQKLKQDIKTKKKNIHKQILQEEKKILEYEIKKNNYIIYIASNIETDFKKELKLVPPKYQN